MAKNTRYNSVGAGVTPTLGHKSFEKGLARPGDRARTIGNENDGPPLGQPSRPGSQSRGARPAKPSKSAGSPPRAARPGSGTVNRKPQARPVPVGRRVR